MFSVVLLRTAGRARVAGMGMLAGWREGRLQAFGADGTHYISKYSMGWPPSVVTVTEIELLQIVRRRTSKLNFIHSVISCLRFRL